MRSAQSPLVVSKYPHNQVAVLAPASRKLSVVAGCLRSLKVDYVQCMAKLYEESASMAC